MTPSLLPRSRASNKPRAIHFEGDALQGISEVWKAARDEAIASGSSPSPSVEVRLGTPATAGCAEDASVTLQKDPLARLEIATLLEAGLPTRYAPKDLRARWTTFGELFAAGAGLVPSYFGGVNKSAYIRKLRSRGFFACNQLIVRSDGAWLPSYKAHVVSIASTEPAIARRVVAPRSTIAIQVFGPGGGRVKATWKPRTAGKTLKTSAPLVNGQMALPVPAQTGTYALTISIGDASPDARVKRLQITRKSPSK